MRDNEGLSKEAAKRPVTVCRTNHMGWNNAWTSFQAMFDEILARPDASIK